VARPGFLFRNVRHRTDEPGLSPPESLHNMKHGTATPHQQEWRMNTMTWIGIIIWGMIITGIGLATAGTPAGIEPDLQPHDVVFLVTGGVLTVLIGISGLMGIMGWIPGVRKEQKTAA
jgi:hypothetical protein